MSKLIVLSNRVNLPHPDTISAGGLAVALQDALEDIGGIWIGWNGQKVSDDKEQRFKVQKYKNVEYHTCTLNQEQYQGYYCGFANNVLWPFMHEQFHYIQYQSSDYKTYQDVNLKFAKHLKKVAQPHDVIWIHDYHLISVAHYCRKLGMKNRIGFFLHIPFPCADQWHHLAVGSELAQHLAEFDVLGFQTQHDRENCLKLLEQKLGLSRRYLDTLNYGSRRIQVKCYPIGVHPEHIQQQAEQTDPIQLPFAHQLKQDSLKIISVDRIDYSKGLVQKIQAIQSFLQSSPEFEAKFQQLQIACPCRLDVKTYQQLYQEFKQHVQCLNDEYAFSDWQPFVCSYEAVAHDALMRLYRAADICWVNSIKDGMNLVAKEYIAAQDPLDPGVLILSKHAGAADQMQAALLVDPHDEQSMTKALKKAIRMSKSERLARYQYLKLGLNEFNIVHWRDEFLMDLRRPNRSTVGRPMSTTRSLQPHQSYQR